jgi:hypothetical protein
VLVLPSTVLGRRRGEVGAEVEQVGLEEEYALHERGLLHLPKRGDGSTEDGVQLVYLAVGLHALVILADALAAEEAGLTAVTGAGVDLHGC